jgi:hypothetical protein
MTVSSAVFDTIKALEKAPLIAGIATGVEDRLIKCPRRRVSQLLHRYSQRFSVEFSSGA